MWGAEAVCVTSQSFAANWHVTRGSDVLKCPSRSCRCASTG